MTTVFDVPADLLIKKVAEEFGIGESIVTRIAEKHNVFRQTQKSRNKRMLDKLKKGETVVNIAKEEGVSETTVSRLAKQHGIDPNNIKNSKKARRNELIKNELIKGTPETEIAKQFGVVEGTIRRLKAEFGLTRTYHFLPKPQEFGYYEIKEQSRNVTKLREAYRRFKLGERTPEILQEIEQTLDAMKAKIQEFKSRFN